MVRNEIIVGLKPFAASVAWPGQTARDRDRQGKIATFNRALQNMKTLAEGGTLPPPPARGGAGGGRGGAPQPPPGQ